MKQAAAVRRPADRPVFELQAVTKAFAATVALDALSLTVWPGETVAVVGPSGAGKTTLLQLLAAMSIPERGEVLIEGTSTARLRPGRELARAVGIMHQQFDLVGALPVVHNVLAGRLGEWGFWRSLLSLIWVQELPRARAALRRVGVEEKLYERTSRLSGGQQQRVALARLLVQQPRAILADEPVASLDPARAEDLIVMLTDIARTGGHTLVCSLHSVPLALRYFSRIVALRRGRVHFDRPAKDVAAADLKALYALPEEG